jgi:uncharacterized protein
MALLDTITKDMITSMKAKDSLRTNTLRSLKTVLMLEANQEALSEDEEMKKLLSAAKKRRDAIEMYEKAGKTELADKEKAELDIIKSYLPEELSENEIKAFVKEIIDRNNYSDAKDFGMVMKELMPKVKGKSDGKLVQEIVKSFLS